MKKILLATTLLAASTGLAAAEVLLSGDARMGVIYSATGNGADGLDGTADDVFGTNFTSRARVNFAASAQTDGGLSFGASFAAHDAGGAANGSAGSVYISGAFGKLSMGDVNSAAEEAVDQVSGVGLTGLGDHNNIVYIGGGAAANDPAALFAYSSGALSFYLSATDASGEILGTDGIAIHPANAGSFGVAAKYSVDAYTVALGFEDDSVDTKWTLGGSVGFGAATVKVIYADQSSTILANDGAEYALSVDYTANALTLSAFYHSDARPAVAQNSYGIGASYDLGGGARVVGGVVNRDTGAFSDTVADFGVSLSF